MGGSPRFAALALLLAAQNPPDGFMAEDQRRHPPRIMPVIGMHVGTADTDRLDLDQRLTGSRYGIRFFAVLHLEGICVYERLHSLSAYFAVKPPSRWMTWPVT